MTKQEFLETLGKILKRELSEAEVNDNLRYYDNYIEQEVKRGKTEAEVLEQLGDPRLIAKTILQVDAQKDASSYEQVFTEEADGGYRSSYEHTQNTSGVHVHTFGGVKGWLILAAVVLVLLVLLKTAFTLFVKLLPVILIGTVILWAKRKISGD